MVTDKVTRDDIRAIKIGQTGIFTLPNAKAVEWSRAVLDHEAFGGYGLRARRDR